MKRSPLRRGKPLERSAPLQGGAPLARHTPLRQRSKKQEALYRVRRPLVASLLAERPVCQRCGAARSTDVHEPRMRSRGADITDPEQCVCLCRGCHNHIHAHPAQATAEGWLIPSWATAPVEEHRWCPWCQETRPVEHECVGAPRPRDPDDDPA